MPQQYYNLVELARICSRQARLAQTKNVARTLRLMASEYMREAAKLDDGKISAIALVSLKEARQRHARSH